MFDTLLRRMRLHIGGMTAWQTSGSSVQSRGVTNQYPKCSPELACATRMGREQTTGSTMTDIVRYLPELEA